MVDEPIDFLESCARAVSACSASGYTSAKVPETKLINSYDDVIAHPFVGVGSSATKLNSKSGDPYIVK